MNSVLTAQQTRFYFKKDKSCDCSFDINLCFQENNWKIARLQDLKSELNAVKRLLNDKNLDEWGKHTAFTDLSSFIINDVKKRLERKPELLTRAWLKFYEILNEYPALTAIDGHFNAVYVCEAPGAFVTASNHFLKSRDSKVKFSWVANTLNPYNEEADVFGVAIVDDRFIRHPNSYKHWFFGNDNTGNVLNRSFLSSLQRKLDKQCDLVTADGGINCVNSPESQELLMYPIIAAEIFTALNTLKSGGCFVVKFFSLFETQTVSLVYLLFNVFEEIIAFKPLTSKQGNSEMYFICIQYTRPNYVQRLTQLYCETPDPLFSRRTIFCELQFTDYFITQFVDCVKLFKEKQSNTILRNLELFRNVDNSERNKIISLKKRISRAFLRSYGLKSINDCDCLCFGFKFTETNYKYCFNFEELYKCIQSNESYDYRMLCNHPFTSSSLTNIYNRDDFLELFGVWKHSNASLMNIADFKLISGSKINVIRCSKFCDSSLLQIYNEVYLNRKRSSLTNLETIFIETLHNTIKSLFSSLCNSQSFKNIRFVICNEKSSFVNFVYDYFQSYSTSANISVKVFDEINPEDEHQCCNIYVIDLFSNDLNCAHNEYETAFKLIENILRTFRLVSSNDLLLLRLRSCLSRLNAGILYVITVLFNKFSVVPCFTCDSDNPSTIDGQVYLFSDGNLEQIETKEQINTITDVFHSCLEFKDLSDNESCLLEIISVPLLLKDSIFCDTIFNGNVVFFTEYLRQRLL